MKALLALGSILPPGPSLDLQPRRRPFPSADDPPHHPHASRDHAVPGTSGEGDIASDIHRLRQGAQALAALCAEVPTHPEVLRKRPDPGAAVHLQTPDHPSSARQRHQPRTNVQPQMSTHMGAWRKASHPSQIQKVDGAFDDPLPKPDLEQLPREAG